MKKRIIMATIGLILALSLTACGSTNETEGSKTPSAASTQEPAASPAQDQQTKEPEEGSQAEVTPGAADAAKESEDNTQTASFQNFTTTDLDGNEVTQDIFADADLTMMNVWATFCDPCIREMPELGELSAEYKDKNVQIIGVAFDTLNQDMSIYQEQVDLAKEIAEKTGANYLHLIPSADLLQAGLMDIVGVPTTYFFDKDGNQVGEAVVGSKNKEVWASIIDERLAMLQ
ncbi:TlpA family protein disulfide reductase [Diplocloster hominis]|uniref:TlpA family protein disulfide reductase n=1 Tax=Diplocloster hominis TaxID=3079010 RepID=UPI0031BA668A